MAQSTKLTVSPTNVEALLDELTDQQRVYTEARMHGLAPLEACKAAGYKHASIQWHSLEKHPKIAPLIKLAVDAPIEKFRISREDVIQGFMDSINAASTSTELTAAWREIAKMQGYYAPDQIEIKHSVENMTLNKLEAMPLNMKYWLMTKRARARTRTNETPQTDYATKNRYCRPLGRQYNFYIPRHGG
jgi:hypothetical protein